LAEILRSAILPWLEPASLMAQFAVLINVVVNLNELTLATAAQFAHRLTNLDLFLEHQPVDHAASAFAVMARP
jgi:hypothetical protein